MNKPFAYAVAALVCCLTVNASAQVYRCKTPGGSTEFSQIPCSKDAQLVQTQRDSIDSTSPPADPFGVQRERDRQQLETEYYRRKNSSDSAAKAVGPMTPAYAARQIDPAACDRADREAQIEARHARKDAAAIRRTQKTADWECGRNLPDDPVAASPSTIPMKATPPPPIITNCDQSGCWDSNGGRYNRAGNSSTYFSSTGACTRVGTSMNCP